jgi:DNA-binding response OmpR family regulator
MNSSDPLAHDPGDDRTAIGAKSPPCRLLIVDADPSLAKLVHHHFAPTGRTPLVSDLRVATGVEVALLELKRAPADLVIVNLQVDDNAGLELIRTIRRRWPRTQVLASSRIRRSDLCIDAWRAGASDMLLAPFQPADLQRALTSARASEVLRLAERNGRLRIVCRRLNKARHEISQQVDLLCNDLVRAYQEMAQQLNLTQLAADFSQALRNEIDVEGVLRRTMEWILRKLGPVNAAVYLPNGEGGGEGAGHFALGAYLNLDTHADAQLIEALSRTLVEQARSARPVALDNDSTLEELFGDDAAPLLGKRWLATGCRTPRECLAVLVIFRSQSEKAGPVLPGLLEAIAPVLAERLENALSFYHRLHRFDDNAGGQEMDAE